MSNRPDNTPVDVGSTWQYTTSTTAGSDLAAQAAVAGKRHYVTDATFSNSSVTAMVAFIKDGSSGKYQVLVPGGATVTKTFATPIRGSVNTAINVGLSAAVTTFYASLSGYTA